MTGLAVLIGEAIVYRTLYSTPSILGMLTAFTLTAASMVTNDYWDRAVDAINVPHRPIPSGLISVRLALSYAVTLMIIGLSSALLTNTVCFLIALLSLSVSLFYNYKGKKLGLLGNVLVGACIAIPLVYGGFVYEAPGIDRGRMHVLLVFDLMVFLAITGREVNKGIADSEGDRIRGVQTVAIRFGAKAAALVATSFYFTAVALSVIAWFVISVSWVYLPIVLVADAGFVVSSFILLRDYTKENAVRVKHMVLVSMLVGLFAFFVGVFT
jgi:geranylgeranylglycerol-phosphate geranylgeranyltransferase